MRTYTLLSFCVWCLGTLLLSAAAAALTPEDILRKTDHLRAPAYQSFVMDGSLTTPRGEMKFKVYSKKGEDSLVLVLSPATEKGKLLLMKQESLWAYIPGTLQPLKVTPQMGLIYGISNGELARLRWSLDYDARQLKEGEDSYELELTSKTKSATYFRMEVMIEKGSFKPISAKVFLQSGKLSKSIYFTGFTSYSDHLMATDLKFIDHLRNQEESKLSFSNVTYQEIPDYYFSTERLSGLSKTLLEKWLSPENSHTSH